MLLCGGQLAGVKKHFKFWNNEVFGDTRLQNLKLMESIFNRVSLEIVRELFDAEKKFSVAIREEFAKVIFMEDTS